MWETALEILQQWGPLGLFIGSFVASTVVPFSTDVVLVGVLLAGSPPWLCFAAATTGNFLGGLTTYGLGRLGKWEWIERLTGVTYERLSKQKALMDKWGVWLALCAWLPIVGDLISVGLGFYKTPFVKTACFLLLGKALRFLGWILLYLYWGERFMAWVA